VKISAHALTSIKSFGPWRELQDIKAMRRNPDAQAGLHALKSLCTEAALGSFRLIAEAPL